MMNKIKTRLSSLIQKISNINYRQIIESAQNTNVEDLFTLSPEHIISYLRKPSSFWIYGLSSAALLSGILLMPSYNRFRTNTELSRLYEINTSNLPKLSQKLIELKKITKNINSAYSSLQATVLDKDQLILLTKIVNQTALRSRVEIISFSPKENNPTISCNLLSSKEVQDLIPSPNEQVAEDISNNYFPTYNNTNDFSANFYELSLHGDYLNIVDFIKFIQYYDLTIVPVCFRTNQIASNSFNNNLITSTDGIVDANLIINIPTHLRRR